MIARSRLLAKWHGQEPGGIHFLMSVPKKPSTFSQRVLNELGIDIDRLHEVAEPILRDSAAQPVASDGLDVIVSRAILNPKAKRLGCVCDEHLMLAILELGEPDVRRTFDRLGVPLEVAVERTRSTIDSVTERTGGPTQLPPTLETLEKGWGLVLEGAIDSAISVFTDVIQSDPEIAGAYLWRAVAHAKNADANSAVADYSEAFRLSPRLATSHALAARGNAHAQTSNLLAAINDYTTAIEFDDEYATDCYYLRGVAHARIGDLDEAISDFTAALRIDHLLPAVYYQRGLAYRRKGEHAMAEEDFTLVKRLGYKGT